MVQFLEVILDTALYKHALQQTPVSLTEYGMQKSQLHMFCLVSIRSACKDSKGQGWTGGLGTELFWV